MTALQSRGGEGLGGLGGCPGRLQCHGVGRDTAVWGWKGYSTVGLERIKCYDI